MKSIAQAAKALCISRQALEYWIKRSDLANDLQTHVQKTSKGTKISEAGIALIQERVGGFKNEQDAKKGANRSANSLHKEHESVDKSDLYGELLHAKDAQINMQTEHIKGLESRMEAMIQEMQTARKERQEETRELHRLLDQSQRLLDQSQILQKSLQDQLKQLQAPEAPDTFNESQTGRMMSFVEKYWFGKGKR